MTGAVTETVIGAVIETMTKSMIGVVPGPVIETL